MVKEQEHDQPSPTFSGASSEYQVLNETNRHEPVLQDNTSTIRHIEIEEVQVYPDPTAPRSDTDTSNEQTHDPAAPPEHAPVQPESRDEQAEGAESHSESRDDPDAEAEESKEIVAQETGPLAETDVEHAPKPDDDDQCEICRVTEARLELRESHSLTTVSSLLTSMNEGFHHTSFDQDSEEDWMFDEHANHWFVVTYCLNSNGRDELRVRWIDPIAEEAHNDGELPALARYIARSLGGGMNLHLLDRMVRVRK